MGRPKEDHGDGGQHQVNLRTDQYKALKEAQEFLKLNKSQIGSPSLGDVVKAGAQKLMKC